MLGYEGLTNFALHCVKIGILLSDSNPIDFMKEVKSHNVEFFDVIRTLIRISL